MNEHKTGFVYLLCFDQKYKHSRHYLGFTFTLDKRIAEHREGKAARLTAVIKSHGIGFQLARVWEGKKALERKLKDRHAPYRLCPLCGQERKKRKAI